MKKILVLFIIICNCFTAFGQDDRDTVVLPVVGQRMGYLGEAMGWMKNSAGQWISRPNRIAGDYVGDNVKFIDYQKQGLGIDNFNAFEVNELSYLGNKYVIFSKQAKSGYYKYPQVKEGWTYREKVFLYIFNPGGLKVDSLKNDSLNVITLTALYNYTYESNTNDDLTFANNIKKAMDGARCAEPTCDLYMLIKPIQSKQVVRFVITNRPVGLEFGLGKDGIKTRYYETSIENFTKLFPGVVIY